MVSEIIGLEKVDKEWLDARPDLKVLGVNTTGLDHIALEECEKRGIKVISLKDHPVFLSTITSTAEHTIGLIIALLRNYKEGLNFPYFKRDYYQGHTLNDKVLGIIGYGRVGKQVKERALAFGMRVLTYDKHEHKDILHDLLKVSDIVSIHIPLENNENFFTIKMFEMMKSTAYLINTSRDKIIQGGALISALKNNIIKGAAIDFVDDMNLVDYATKHKNLILTPHLGGNTFEDRKKTKEYITNLVNLELQKWKQ